MVALRKAVGDDREQERLQDLTEKVANSCWNDPHSYHGCHTFILDCLTAGPEDEDCVSMYAKQDNKELSANLTKSVKMYMTKVVNS